MIKVNHIKTYGFAAAIRGMRNPYDSWSKSDSRWVLDDMGYEHYRIGQKDLELMQRLFKAGTEHRKFMRQIFVSMDLTAPDYWWMQFDAYKIGITCNSQSKMHTLVNRPFRVEDFSVENVPGYKVYVEQVRPNITPEKEATEEWRDIESGYSVSNLGRVKRNGKLLSGSTHKDGYIFITINGKQTPAHRLICKAFHPDTYAEGLCVNHIDGNKQNNAAENLEWTTQKENIAHSRAMHLQPVSCGTYRGKLSEEEREEVKRLFDAGVSKRQIAEKFGVTHTCINDMLNGKHPFHKKINYFMEYVVPTVNRLNELRDQYLAEDDPDEKRRLWEAILALTPLSYNQTRTVTMNYEVAATICRQRSGHKLGEWHDLIRTLKLELPYLKEIMDGPEGSAEGSDA